jgi:hypothetical protein
VYLQNKILWIKEPFLGSDGETKNETTIGDMQRSARNNGSTLEGGVFYVVHSKAISRDRPSSVQLVSAVQWSDMGGECVRGLLRFSLRELLLLEAGS